MDKATKLATDIVQIAEPSQSGVAFNIALVLEIVTIVLERCEEEGDDSVAANAKSGGPLAMFAVRSAARKAGVPIRARRDYVKAVFQVCDDSEVAELSEAIGEVRTLV